MDQSGQTRVLTGPPVPHPQADSKQENKNAECKQYPRLLWTGEARTY